jgi:hypothetical protein
MSSQAQPTAAVPIVLLTHLNSDKPFRHLVHTSHCILYHRLIHQPTVVVSQPTPQATVIAAAPQPTYTAAPKSSLRSRLVAFCVGATLAGGVGYFRLQQDIWSSAAAIESQVAAVGPALARSQQLEKEVADLRARVQKLESSKK